MLQPVVKWVRLPAGSEWSLVEELLQSSQLWPDRFARWASEKKKDLESWMSRPPVQEVGQATLPGSARSQGVHVPRHTLSAIYRGHHCPARETSGDRARLLEETTHRKRVGFLSLSPWLAPPCVLVQRAVP